MDTSDSIVEKNSNPQSVMAVAAIFGAVLASAIHFALLIVGPVDVQTSMRAFEPFSMAAGWLGIVLVVAALPRLFVKSWPDRMFGALLVVTGAAFVYFSYFGGAVDFQLAMGQSVY